MNKSPQLLSANSAAAQGMGQPQHNPMKLLQVLIPLQEASPSILLHNSSPLLQMVQLQATSTEQCQFLGTSGPDHAIFLSPTCSPLDAFITQPW